MPSFTYVVRDPATQKERTGSIDAASEEQASAALLSKNLMVLKITEKAKQGARAGGSVALADIVMFTRQLATMVDAGLAIVQSLQALAEQTTNKAMKDVIKDVCTRVEGGDNFSDALRKHPKVFDKLYTSMIDAGEKGGLLAEILSRVATFLENRQRMNKKIKSAMMYPTMVSLVAVGITIFLLVKVVPVFADIFGGFGAKLPAPTQFVINLSDFMKKFWYLLIAAAGGVYYGWTAYLKTPQGRAFWDDRRIKLPVFGNIAHKIVLARFTRTLASLIRSGVPILEVLNIVANTSGHVGMEKSIRQAAMDIEKGDGISSALGKHPIFPVMIIRMLTAGEQTGKIDQMLERVSDTLDEEIETILAGLTSLIEPILIVVLGVVIGGLVIAMFMPIFKMSEILDAKK
jgi:type IV pilus assembly protein PilC